MPGHPSWAPVRIPLGAQKYKPKGLLPVRLMPTSTFGSDAMAPSPMAESSAADAAAVLAGLVVAETVDAECASALAPFAPLIGSWDLDVTYFLPDGTTREVPGEWHFSWALDGRALADVWITPSRAARSTYGEGEWGMTLRFWDAEAGILRSTWHGPQHAVVLPFRGRFREGGIVLEGEFTAGKMTRWVFSDLTANSFSWHAEEEEDGALTVVQRFAARRSGR